MKDQKKPNICYVFSQVTLDLAIDEWAKEKRKNKSQDNEQYLIAATAIPWFLKHINATDSINMFTHEDLLSEIQEWKSEQVIEFPQQEKRIEDTCKLIIRFFESETVIRYKMTVEV